MAGVGQDGTKALYQNTEGNPHHPALGLIIPLSSCVSTWETSSYRAGPRNPGVGHGKVGSPPQSKKAPRRMSDLTSMKNWVVNPHCPQAWLSSCLGKRLSSNIPLPPLLRWNLSIHCGLTMKMAPNGVPPPPQGPDPKSGHPLTNPSQGQRDQIWWATPAGGFHTEMLKTPQVLVENWCPVTRWQCLLASYTKLSANLKPFTLLIGRLWSYGYLWPNKKQ